MVGPFPCDGAEEELSGVVDVVGHGELVAGPRPAALLVDQNLKTGPVRRVCARPAHRRAKAAVWLRRSWLLPSWLLLEGDDVLLQRRGAGAPPWRRLIGRLVDRLDKVAFTMQQQHTSGGVPSA